MSTVPLSAVKTHLNITSTAQDGELQAFIDAAETAIEQRVGPLCPVVTTERSRANGGTFVLGTTPVVSLTSLTPVGGTAYDVATLDVDVLAGTVGRTSGGSFSTGNFDIVYVAGRATCPADLELAVKELVRHLWESQRTPARFPGSDEPIAPTGAGYLMPYRVQELLAPHEQFGFA